MSIEYPVNMASLGLVQDELTATLVSAASALEEYVKDSSDEDLLVQALGNLNQIAGILNMLQLRGAESLTRSAVLALEGVKDLNDEETSSRLDKIGEYFFILPRYIEYVGQNRKAIPNLLLPLINDLRGLVKAPRLADSHFIELTTAEVIKPKRGASSVHGEDLKPLARRLRHMYQVGLLNVMRDQQVRSSLGLMQRSIQRIDKITGNQKLGKLWWLTDASLSVLAFGNTPISKERKLMLGQIDRQIKQIQEKGAAAFDLEPSPAVIKDLIFILMLSGGKHEYANEVLNTLGLDASSITEADLHQERESLRGPSGETISSLINVLQDELKLVKDTLELAAQSGIDGIEDFDSLIDGLRKIADILSVVGLGVASNSLKEETEQLANWRNNSGEGTHNMMEVANTLLYVEGSISSLSDATLTPEQLEKANSLTQEEVIASSQLADAEISLIREAEAGLALIKRALHAFAESSFDSNHISNVPSTLDGVRGATLVLNKPRATAVVSSSISFVESLLDQDSPAALQQLLETFADAIIGLEYYLDILSSDRDANDEVLSLAEESLEALGYPVE